MTGLTWGEFYDIVKDEVNKGDTSDKVIANKVWMAVRTLEQNESYKWNEKLLSFKISKNADGSNILELPSDFKSPIVLQISKTGFKDCMDTLELQDPDSFDLGQSVGGGWGYWIQNNRWIWLPEELEDGTSGVFWYNAFTLRSEMERENTSPILKYGQEALLGLTMQNLAAYCREPLWRELYLPMAEVGIKTMHIADAELRRASETGSFGGING